MSWSHHPHTKGVRLMPRRKPQSVLKPDYQKEKEMLARLSAGLSEEEIQRVLTCALSMLGSEGIGNLAAKLGPDTGAALRRAMQSSSSSKNASPKPGPAKILQEWNKAWEDWNGVISEACDEEGEYVIQEHDWEQPYFDPLSVTGDLEPIAARMATLLSRVLDEELDPDFSFAEAVAESVDEIASSLPEWMSPFDNESFCLGPKATGCLVEWELRSCRREGRGLFHLIDKLRVLEQSNRGLALDGKTIAAFVHGLGKDGKRDVLDGIRAHRDEDHWKKVLNSAHSGWFLIYKDLCRGQDRSGYLETCRARISQDWSLAIPVIKELARKKVNEETCQVCAEAATSFLHIRDGKKWDPRETLIASRGGGPTSEKPDERFIFLLTAWNKAAAALGREDTAEAIQLQSCLVADWRNWDKALAAFNRVSSPGLDAMRDKLFDQWRSLVTERSTDRFDFDRDHLGLWEKPRADRSLVDAAWKGEAGAAGLQESIRLQLKDHPVYCARRPLDSIKQEIRDKEIRVAGGVRAAARNARTGELTPPGILRCARSKRLLLEVLMSPPVSRSCGLEQFPEAPRLRGDVRRIEQAGDHGQGVRAGLRCLLFRDM